MKRTLAIVSILVVGAGIFAVYRYWSDPEGHSRRHPQSMHAHQTDWPKSCQHREGSLQSPISISSRAFLERAIEKGTARTKSVSGELIDVGHTFQLRYRGESGGHLSFEGRDYELRQFHFHKPSEHLIDGKQFEMEVHFVFLPIKSGGSKALVVGFPMVVGEDNRELAKAWSFLPPYREGYGEREAEAHDWHNPVGTHELDFKVLSHSEKVLKSALILDLAGLLPKKSNFFVYEGSLTTPSCDEGITHAVSLTPIEIGHEQTEHFEGYYEGTNRDLQPLNNVSMRKFRRAEITFEGDQE